MSVKIMSAIFETEFTDLKDGAGNVTKASTAKFVLLALADHANDEGEGAYPSLTRMELKTGLSRPTLINTYDALKFNRMIVLVGTSKLKTSNYTINIQALPRTFGDGEGTLLVKPVDQDGKATLPPLVKPLDQGSQATLPPLVKPLYPNHSLTTIKPSKEDEDDAKFVRQLYEDNIGVVNPLMLGLLRNASLTYPRAWFHPAFELAAKNNARSWRYVETILEGWKNYGFGWKPERAKPPTRAAQRTNDAYAALLMNAKELAHGN